MKIAQAFDIKEEIDSKASWGVMSHLFLTNQHLVGILSLYLRTLSILLPPAEKP